jgi:hypothetical protein
MTKFLEWDRFKSMSSRQKSEVSTSTSFSEQRDEKGTEEPKKDFGMKKMETEVNVEWPDEN